LDRFILIVEKAAGVFLRIVAAITFFSAVLRYVFSTGIPDGFFFACMFQGIALFWGLASTTYEGKHIVVDILWEMSGPAGRRVIDIAATVITAAFLVVFSWMLYAKVISTYEGNQISSEVGFEIWPYYVLASLGIVCAAALSLIRLWRLAVGRTLANG
jgi:TRAP-type C4-dicarboxylate transport system permease small subunit